MRVIAPLRGAHNDAPRGRRRRSHPIEADRGTVSIYLLGVAVVAMMLIVVTYGITVIALARIRLLDAADSAALASANAFDERTYLSGGIGEAVPLTNDTVRSSAADSLSAQSLPTNVQGWRLDAGTGTPDGQTAVVVLSAQVRIPVAGTVIGDRASLTLTVHSRARAGTR